MRRPTRSIPLALSAVSAAFMSAGAFAPPSTSLHRSASAAQHVSARISAQSAITNSNNNSPTQLHFNRSPRDSDLDELDLLERQITLLERDIDRKQASDQLLLSAVTVSTLLALGAECAHAESCSNAVSNLVDSAPLPDVLLASRTPDAVLVVLDLLSSIGEFFRDAFALIFTLFAAILPILGKAVIAAGKAAVPALQKGFTAFFSYFTQAVNDSGEAAKPYLGEASSASKVVLDPALGAARENVEGVVGPVATKVGGVGGEVVKSLNSVSESLVGKPLVEVPATVTPVAPAAPVVPVEAVATPPPPPPVVEAAPTVVPEVPPTPPPPPPAAPTPEQIADQIKSAEVAVDTIRQSSERTGGTMLQ